MLPALAHIFEVPSLVGTLVVKPTTTLGAATQYPVEWDAFASAFGVSIEAIPEVTFPNCARHPQG